MPLAVQIEGLEQSLLERRRRISIRAAGIGPKVRGRMVSPGMLLAAAGLGVLLARSSRPGAGWSVLTALSAVATGSTLLKNAASLMSQWPPPDSSETRTSF